MKRFIIGLLLTLLLFSAFAIETKYDYEDKEIIRPFVVWESGFRVVVQ